MKTCIAFATVLILCLASPGIADDTQPVPRTTRVTPNGTVAELARELREEGFQWRFLGRRLAFTATVLTHKNQLHVQIDGMDKERFDTAMIHNLPPNLELKPGERLQISGMIVDQWYAVWQIWNYEISRVKN